MDGVNPGGAAARGRKAVPHRGIERDDWGAGEGARGVRALCPSAGVLQVQAGS